MFNCFPLIDTNLSMRLETAISHPAIISLVYVTCTLICTITCIVSCFEYQPISHKVSCPYHVGQACKTALPFVRTHICMPFVRSRIPFYVLNNKQSGSRPFSEIDPDSHQHSFFRRGGLRRGQSVFSGSTKGVSCDKNRKLEVSLRATAGSTLSRLQFCHIWTIGWD